MGVSLVQASGTLALLSKYGRDVFVDGIKTIGFYSGNKKSCRFLQLLPLGDPMNYLLYFI